MPTAVAPFVAAFRRRLANLPGPARSSGEASNGEPVTVELLVAGVWTDITAYCLVRNDSGSISVTSGIHSEGSQTERAQAGLELANTDGRFSPRNPTGEYFDALNWRNDQIRISVPDGLGGKSYRIWGEASEWAPNWDRSGNDVWTDVTVNGILQRLAQGPAPERSVIYQAVTDPTAPAVVAYWPCEDPAGSTFLASGLPAGGPMTWSSTLTLAAFEGFAASDPLPDLTTAVLSGGVAKYDDPTATQVRFLVSIPTGGLSDGKVICAIDQLDYSPGSTQFWELYYTTTGNTLILRQHDADGALLGIELTHTLDVRGRRLYVSVEFQESGTGITRALRLTDVLTGTVYAVSDTPTLTQLTRVTRVQFGPASRSVVGPIGTQYLPGVAVGHVTVENALTATTALGVRLNPIGETAGRRIQRLCGEEGIAFEWIGDLDDTVALGAQGKQNLLSLVQEAVQADGGLLYETTGQLGLGYRTRASLYNQDPVLTLSYPGYNLAEIPIPVTDDRYVQNRVTVTVDGVTASYEEPDGPLGTAAIGVYGETSGTTLNLSTTDTATLRDQAAWRVHLGTVEDERFPQISVNLAHPSITSDMRRAILALRMGDRAQITGMPQPWMAPDTVDQLVIGIDQTITHFGHRLTFICAPASPYTVGVLDDDDARIDTDGSELLDAVTSSATELTVVPSAGEITLWTLDSDDWPFDIRMGGEVLTVTAVADWLSDAFGRSVSNGWGTSDSGQAWSTGGGTAADYAVGSGVGSHTLATVSASRRTFVDATFTDFDYQGDITTSATATGGSLYGSLTGRYLDSSNLYAARLEFTTADALILSLRKIVAGVETQLATYALPDTYTPGTFVRLRFEVVGARLRARAWLATDAQPDWQISATDGAISTTSFLGTRSIAAGTNTNVNPVVSYDNLRVINPQTLTVTRSVNGVVKAHDAGASLECANPWILPL
jgi:hypothetical protein